MGPSTRSKAPVPLKKRTRSGSKATKTPSSYVHTSKIKPSLSESPKAKRRKIIVSDTIKHVVDSKKYSKHAPTPQNNKVRGKTVSIIKDREARTDGVDKSEHTFNTEKRQCPPTCTLKNTQEEKLVLVPATCNAGENGMPICSKESNIVKEISPSVLDNTSEPSTKLEDHTSHEVGGNVEVLVGNSKTEDEKASVTTSTMENNNESVLFNAAEIDNGSTTTEVTMVDTDHVASDKQIEIENETVGGSTSSDQNLELPKNRHSSIHDNLNSEHIRDDTSLCNTELITESDTTNSTINQTESQSKLKPDPNFISNIAEHETMLKKVDPIPNYAPYTVPTLKEILKEKFYRGNENMFDNQLINKIPVNCDIKVQKEDSQPLLEQNKISAVDKEESSVTVKEMYAKTFQPQKHEKFKNKLLLLRNKKKKGSNSSSWSVAQGHVTKAKFKKQNSIVLGSGCAKDKNERVNPFWDYLNQATQDMGNPKISRETGAEKTKHLLMQCKPCFVRVQDFVKAWQNKGISPEDMASGSIPAKDEDYTSDATISYPRSDEEPEPLTVYEKQYIKESSRADVKQKGNDVLKKKRRRKSKVLPIAPRTFDQKKSREEFDKLHYSPSPDFRPYFCCKLCAFRCQKNSVMREHTTIHTNVILLKCGYCHKTYSTKKECLDHHGKDHEGFKRNFIKVKGSDYYIEALTEYDEWRQLKDLNTIYRKFKFPEIKKYKACEVLQSDIVTSATEDLHVPFQSASDEEISNTGTQAMGTSKMKTVVQQADSTLGKGEFSKITKIRKSLQNPQITRKIYTSNVPKKRHKAGTIIEYKAKLNHPETSEVEDPDDQLGTVIKYPSNKASPELQIVSVSSLQHEEGTSHSEPDTNSLPPHADEQAPLSSTVDHSHPVSSCATSVRPATTVGSPLVASHIMPATVSQDSTSSNTATPTLRAIAAQSISEKSPLLVNQLNKGIQRLDDRPPQQFVAGVAGQPQVPSVVNTVHTSGVYSPGSMSNNFTASIANQSRRPSKPQNKTAVLTENLAKLAESSGRIPASKTAGPSQVVGANKYGTLMIPGRNQHSASHTAASNIPLPTPHMHQAGVPNRMSLPGQPSTAQSAPSNLPGNQQAATAATVPVIPPYYPIQSPPTHDYNWHIQMQQQMLALEIKKAYQAGFKAALEKDKQASETLVTGQGTEQPSNKSRTADVITNQTLEKDASTYRQTVSQLPVSQSSQPTSTGVRNETRPLDLSSPTSVSQIPVDNQRKDQFHNPVPGNPLTSLHTTPQFQHTISPQAHQTSPQSNPTLSLQPNVPPAPLEIVSTPMVSRLAPSLQKKTVVDDRRQVSGENTLQTQSVEQREKQSQTAGVVPTTPKQPDNIEVVDIDDDDEGLTPEMYMQFNVRPTNRQSPLPQQRHRYQQQKPLFQHQQKKQSPLTHPGQEPPMQQQNQQHQQQTMRQQLYGQRQAVSDASTAYTAPQTTNTGNVRPPPPLLYYPRTTSDQGINQTQCNTSSNVVNHQLVYSQAAVSQNSQLSHSQTAYSTHPGNHQIPQAVQQNRLPQQYFNRPIFNEAGAVNTNNNNRQFVNNMTAPQTEPRRRLMEKYQMEKNIIRNVFTCHLCQYKGPTAYQLQIHMEQHRKHRSRYICSHCNDGPYNSITLLNEHCAAKHAGLQVKFIERCGLVE